MTGNAWLQLFVFVGVLIGLAVPLGGWLARVYSGEATLTQRALGPLERRVYRVAGVKADEEMSWQRYALAVLLFNVAGLLVVYALQRLQAFLPLNPAGLPALPPAVAFNTAVSFASNTNWQAYGGETTMSHLTQLAALTVQNFVSAATGLAVLVALIRGLTRKKAEGLGSFWVDLTRSTLFVLLPLATVLALALVSQGVVQTFAASATAQLVDPFTLADGTVVAQQPLALGPAASQVAIKQLGTNGGGFFNVNSAHPFENPTPFSNLLEVLAILLIPASLCFTFGAMVKDRRQGWALLAAMLAIFIPVLVGTVLAEQHGNPVLTQAGADQSVGGNLEGKEVRFGVTNSALWAVATTAASNGSVNAMHDSFTPLGGLGPMWLMQLGEIVFGGVGSGLYGLLIYAIIAVFIAGLMVGRTPEYLGKKIEAFEMKMAALVHPDPRGGRVGRHGHRLLDPRGHGRPGQPRRARLQRDPLRLLVGREQQRLGVRWADRERALLRHGDGVCMWLGRYWVIVPVLAIAGKLATKRFVPPSAGTLPTHTPLFVGLLVGTIVLVGALTFFPALALGPIVEHLSLGAH